MNKVRILHITRDDKFFDSVFASFQRVTLLENTAVFVAKHANYKLNLIKTVNSVNVLDKKGVIRLLKTADYDVVYFHALPPPCWYQLLYIPKGKTIIWWAWGYDIYLDYYAMRPLTPIPLYKSKTQAIVKKMSSSVSFQNRVRHIVNLLFRRYWHLVERHYGLKRIDYFQPVLSIEYSLIQEHNSCFAAKEFYPIFIDIPSEDKNVSCKPCDGMILFGNSATDTNNHIDVIEYLKKARGIQSRIIMPISYGDELFKKLLSENDFLTQKDTKFLKSLLPSKEYFEIVDTCSYMVSGVLRQQSIGSIIYSLKNGIKLFLFKDSIVYRYCKMLGFVVFAIEDINENSFSIPLTPAECNHNYEVWKRELQRKKVITDEVLNKLTSKYCK